MSCPLRSHLDLDEAFYSLDLGLAEGSSVLGTDVRPHCQVGRLVCCLKHTHTHHSVLARTAGVLVHVLGRFKLD